MQSTIGDDHVDARPDLGDVLDGYEGSFLQNMGCNCRAGR